MVRETNLQFSKQLSKRTKTNFIIVHHSASPDVSAATIHDWHLRRGWAGIGYHFVVRSDGSIERGRPVDMIGAHASGYNSRSIGICLVGDFTIYKPTPQQIQAARELIAVLKKSYPDVVVIGHKAVAATACPGHYLDVTELVPKGQTSRTDFEDHWAKSEIIEMMEAGIFATTDKFRPNDPVTRAELAVVCSRLIRLLSRD